MNSFVKIQNDGEVDSNAFRLMGATSKAGDDTKIGYFGSGIKYAVATALRMGIPLRVFSGEKEIKITTKSAEMRGQKFEVIQINEEPTSITTDMGRDWEPWFIFREFYCNAIDEGGDVLSVSNEPKGEKGKTIIYMGMNDVIKPIFDNMDKYFSKRRTEIFQYRGVKIFPRIDDRVIVYRKGIRVFHENYKSIYDYDCDSIEINEARTASDWAVKYGLMNWWKEHASVEMINQLCQEGSETMEMNFDWELGYSTVGANWLEALKNKVIIPREHGGYFVDDMSNNHVLLPHSLCLCLHKSFGKQLIIRGMDSGESTTIEMPATKKEQGIIDDAVEFLQRSEMFSDIDSYPIKVAVFEKKAIWGKASQGSIYLSRSVFTEGRRKVVETLLEEYIHLKNSVYDNTREMQDVLIQYVISSLEEETKTYL